MGLSAPNAPRLLLVEDEALVALSEKKTLEKHGFQTLLAYSGEEAVRTATEDVHLDLVLMDIDLGTGIDGTEAAERILATLTAPIVFLTSHREKEYVDRVKSITNYGYVLKDSGEFVLIESINMALELFAAHRRLERENEERKLIERQLREEQAELDAVYDNTPDIVLLLDEERRIRKANVHVRDLTGSSPEDLLGVRAGEAVRCIHHLDDPRGCGFGPYCHRCKVRRTVVATLEHQQGFKNVEETLRLAVDGRDRDIPVLLSSSLIYIKNEPLVVLSIQDITERKQAEEALRESEKRYRLLAEHAVDIVYTRDIDSERFTYASPSVERVLGYSQDEICSLTVRDILPAESYERSQRTIRQQRDSTADSNLQFEIEVIHKQGHCIPMETYASFLRDENGDIVSIVGVARDITERKRAEKELQQAVTEKDHLLAELNHRVKNNLKMVGSLVHLKDSAMGSDVDLSDVTNQINAIQIVHEKLQEAADVTHIDLRSYIQDLLVTVFRSFAAQSVTVENNIPSTSIRTRAAVPIGLLINEAATNAIKHGFTEEEVPRFTVTMEQDPQNESYVLSISNSGKPFPEEVDIENPQTLGLQLITALVAQLQGTLNLRRSPIPVLTIRFPSSQT